MRSLVLAISVAALCSGCVATTGTTVGYSPAYPYQPVPYAYQPVPYGYGWMNPGLQLYSPSIFFGFGSRGYYGGHHHHGHHGGRHYR